MTSTPSPQADPAAFWDGLYGEPGCAYGEQPNDFLREQAAALPTGEALCLAEGEGRNAVHLAQLGHRVLAQDLSAVGLARPRSSPPRRASIWWWLELLVLQERRRWIEEGPYHHGDSAVLQILGRKST